MGARRGAEQQHHSCGSLVGSALYYDELLDLRGPKVYNPLHHKLWSGVYYDTVSKRVCKFVLRRFGNGEVVYVLEGYIETGPETIQRLSK